MTLHDDDMHVGEVYLTPRGHRARIVKARLTDALQFMYRVEYLDAKLKAKEFPAAKLSPVKGVKYPPPHPPPTGASSIRWREREPRLTAVEGLPLHLLPEVGAFYMTEIGGSYVHVKVVGGDVRSGYTVRKVLVGGLGEEVFRRAAGQLYG